MAGAAHSGDGHVWAVPVLQREFHSVQPDAVCVWAAPHDPSGFRNNTFGISHAFGGRGGDYRGNAWRPAAGRCPACTSNGSRIDGVSFGLVCDLRVVLGGGETHGDEIGGGAGDSSLVNTSSDESAASFSGALFAGRMDCVWDLGSAGSRAALGRELKCPSCILSKANCFAGDDSFPPSWPASDSDIWTDGRNRLAGCGVRVASRF